MDAGGAGVSHRLFLPQESVSLLGHCRAGVRTADGDLQRSMGTAPIHLLDVQLFCGGTVVSDMPTTTPIPCVDAHVAGSPGSGDRLAQLSGGEEVNKKRNLAGGPFLHRNFSQCFLTLFSKSNTNFVQRCNVVE